MQENELNFNEIELECNREIASYNDYLKHYGTPRHSGRYPWGSGDNPYQRTKNWLSRFKELKSTGMTETEMAQALGALNKNGKPSTTTLRAYITIANDFVKRYQIDAIKSMQGDGISNVEIAKRLGLKGESTVRSMMKPEYQQNRDLAMNAANSLKKILEENPGKLIDVGKSAELQLGISKTKMDVALEILQQEGYQILGSRVPQATNPDQQTTLRLLATADTPERDAYAYDKIRQITEYKLDANDNLKPSFVYPKSMDSKRLEIIYLEDGGKAKDGLIEIRPGVADLSLGNSHYAQVRILVDDNYFLKGMAAYNNNLPEGIDVRFNSNKSKEKGLAGSLKPIKKDDPNNPFGSAIKENGGQSYYIDENGKEQLSLINKREDEGGWGSWSKELPSQFLSKQPSSLVKQQLRLTIDNKKDEYEEIMRVENPTVRKKLLEDFASDCDTQASELKAAALPGQKYQVLLPVSSLKDNECYAPQFKDGEELALIRYPHTGTFEIPIVKVNNYNEEGKNRITPLAMDAIGINIKVASQLSGADFDGDTVMAIPINEKANIHATPWLKGLRDFDTDQYAGVEQPDGTFMRNGVTYQPMRKQDVQKQMGMISNLITDMTVSGASSEEMARAVRHSMVVIDAVKHNLDYLTSEQENGIMALKKLYQQKPDPTKKPGGASTLISKAGAELRVPERKEGAFFNKTNKHKVTQVAENQYVDDETGELYSNKDVHLYKANPLTGEKVYRETGRQYYKVSYIGSNGRKRVANTFEDYKTGELYYKNDKGEKIKVTNEKITGTLAPDKLRSTPMAETSDARTLISPIASPNEKLYAEFANNLKALANKARKESINTKDTPYSPEANKKYKEEVESIDIKLRNSELNAPKERQAQAVANTEYMAIFQENPNLTNEEKRKIRNQAIVRARARVGAKRYEISLTDKEWEAIQAGAISTNKLKLLLIKAGDQVRTLATPKQTVVPSAIKVNRMKSLANSGYTIAEIAKILGYSTTTINKYLGGATND